jgi:hypothetical protein
MPSPERGPSGPEEHPSTEHEPVPYHRVVRFAGEHPAGAAYAAAQQAIFDGPPNDLSAYRFQLNHIFHVAVLGVPPPPALEAQLDEILLRGEPAELPAEILQALTNRRRQMRHRGPWTEGHYRPGKPLAP